ncbi:phosphoribosylamine--glycine ligase [Candidatus Micrarchaeota archaeon]|nr:phosphoribosylamine--glycine ligase [Candidatus Micrarchaeota archaeon]
MKIVLVGSGAREHAIAEQLSKSASLYSIMEKKHPGIASLSQEVLLCNPTDKERVVSWCREKGIELGFVSPDGLLEKGVTDILASAGMKVASPSREAARIEWDKGYARTLLQKHNVAGLPAFKVVSSAEEASAFLAQHKEVVVKPLGLTGGKGVRVMGEHLHTEQDVLDYVSELLKKDKQALLEEKLDGEEFSLQAFSDGERLSVMPPVQDHKRAFVNDAGPNTGGMGSYSTGRLLPFMELKDLEEAKSIMQQTIDAMQAEGNPFRGILYGGFMITRDGVKLIEYNARFGDPEAMNVLMVLRTQLSEILQSIAEGKLIPVAFSTNCTVVKYLVPEGYPENGKKDCRISIDNKAIWECGGKTFLGSVYESDGQIYTTSSRTAAVAAQDASLERAEEKAECCTRAIQGPLWHRPDIGTPLLIRKRTEHMRRLNR